MSSSEVDKSPLISESPPDSLALQPIPKKSQQIKTDKPRPHICSVCTRAFARLEHLKRHERSHTNEKPFQCAACGRCFARRDLVLRHQQKLHTSLSATTPRRNSAKDLESNENIIILDNNTNANAPLPPSLATSSPFTNLVASHMSPMQPQLVSPPKMTTNDKGPHFRTSVFNSGAPNSSKQQQIRPGSDPGMNSLVGMNLMPSPIPTNSSQNTPPNASNLYTVAHQQNGHPQHTSPQNGDSPVNQYSSQNGNFPTSKPMPKQFNNIQRGNMLYYHQLNDVHARHASFSAASSTSYTNRHDAAEIQQNNNLSQGPSHVGFATPQLSAAELSSKGFLNDVNSAGLDWNNIDTLELSKSYPGGFDELKTSNGLYTNIPAYFDSMVASHQFQDPNHPHHIKGTTPFEFGMNPPNKINDEVENHLSIKQDFDLDDTGITIKRLKKSQESSTSMPQETDELQNQNDDWLEEILKTPFEKNLPTASRHIGFTDSPRSDDSLYLRGDVSALFRSRQVDLLKQMDSEKNGSLPKNEHDIDFVFSISEANPQYITEELRNRIILVSNLTDLQFPPLQDLNSYLNLYEAEFNKYFPFIHLPSFKNPMVDNFDNTPLLLAMGSIGALYSYHDSNSLLLFNLSKFHIQKFFENEIGQDSFHFKKVPLMAHQCLVLHIFITLFLNEPNMVEVSSRQIRAMAGLIQSTNFNKPLERFLVPPETATPESNSTLIQQNFDYFVMAQSRIRTLYVFYMLQMFRASIMMDKKVLPAQAIDCGTHCCPENLWNCQNSSRWLDAIHGNNKSIVELSNGELFKVLIKELNDHYSDSKIPFNSLLSLIMYVHEVIEEEQSKQGTVDDTKWRLSSRPKLESLIRSWEALFIKNGGILSVNKHNNHMLHAQSSFKLILPLHGYAKMRLCFNFRPIMEKVIAKEWAGFNVILDRDDYDIDSLKECTEYALDTLRIWTQNISVVNDAKRTSLRTPVFFVTCAFFAIIFVSQYVLKLELESRAANVRARDQVLWILCESLLNEVEQVLAPIRDDAFYAEFIREHSVDASKVLPVRKLVEQGSDSETILASIRATKLSLRSLALGVRILADAPVWPMAVTLAEALKNRISHLSRTK